MRKIIFVVTGALLSSSFALADAGVDRIRAKGRSDVVTIEAERVFVPQGFDDNDTTPEVVMDFAFPNNCYNVGPAKLDHVDYEKQQIFVRQQAYKYSGCICAQLYSRHFKAVELPQLPSGNYQVLSENSHGEWIVRGTLPIAPKPERSPQETPDDYLYLQVGQFGLTTADKNFPFQSQAESSSAAPVLVMDGLIPDSCTSFSRVDKHVDLEKHVIEVLPILQRDESLPCSQVQERKQVRVPLENLGLVSGERYLIHIRSAGGVGHNLVVTM